MSWQNVAVMVGPPIGWEPRRDAAGWEPRRDVIVRGVTPDDRGPEHVDQNGCRCHETSGGFVTVCDCSSATRSASRSVDHRPRPAADAHRAEEQHAAALTRPRWGSQHADSAEAPPVRRIRRWGSP